MSAVVLTLTKVRTELGASVLEGHVADALSLPRSEVTVLVDEDRRGRATLVAHRGVTSVGDADDVAATLHGIIRNGQARAWAAGRDATCEVAADEESASVDEEDALEMWRGMSEEERTGHLDMVPNPDGVMIRPAHEAEGRPSGDAAAFASSSSSSPVESQLRRDPTLLEYDNVRRVDASRIHDIISWDEPVVITNAVPDDVLSNRGTLERRRLASVHGGTEVRTGNRETLIDNGVTNSKPMPLSEALSPRGGRGGSTGRIVFSPVRELPDAFADELRPFTDCFPPTRRPTEEGGGSPSPAKKYTLTLASEGFGIGMHKHGAASFMLLLGRKKWYMSSPEGLEGYDDDDDDDRGTTTHPGFYREKSSHKCIQREGEVLFVPNGWYHEIFNLEYTAGIQEI